jgi:hypothetical protein
MPTRPTTLTARSRSHPGCATVPAALALGEQFGAHGMHFLRAVALGYDVGTRVTMSMGGPSYITAQVVRASPRDSSSAIRRTARAPSPAMRPANSRTEWLVIAYSSPVLK